MTLKTEKREQVFRPYVDAMKRGRAASGLSQVALAEAVGFSTKYVTMIETRKRVPSLESLLALMSAAGVKRETAEDLMEDVLGSFTWEGHQE